MTQAQNRQLVADFFEAFFNRHVTQSAMHFLHPDYIQHDFDVPPGRDGFMAHFEQVFSIFPHFRVDPIHIVADGDLVILHGYGTTDPGKIEVLVCDTYRVKDALLYEHWGTVQPLPPEQFRARNPHIAAP